MVGFCVRAATHATHVCVSVSEKNVQRPVVYTICEGVCVRVTRFNPVKPVHVWAASSSAPLCVCVLQLAREVLY